jgi:phospholipase D1/2
MSKDAGARSVLELGHNVWRAVRPEAAGVLVDAADYYTAFYQAALRAQHSIVLSGWQFDRGVPLLRGDAAPPGAEVRLLRFLNSLCEQKPELEVYILAWDFHVVFALEREWMQSLYFEWATNERLHFRFDDTQAAQGSHHQKFVVIDRAISFVGGIDLCEARWDDRSHRSDNPLRTSHGAPAKPYHDVQACLLGCDTADVLRDLFADRWARTAGPALSLPTCKYPAGQDTLPEQALPLGSGTIGFSRTDARGPENTVREVQRLLVDAIGAAERLIYIETQYFSSHVVFEALVSRMRTAGRARLEIVIIVNAKPEALKEELAIGLRQAKILTSLAKTAAETQHQLGAYYTLSEGDAKDRPATYIHSKLLSIDDRFLTVGSANLTNRSMGVDTELNVSWEATDVSTEDEQLRGQIRALRVSLLAEHAGLMSVAPPSLDTELGHIDGLVARLDQLAAVEGARLRPVAATFGEKVALALFDPEALPFDPDSPEYEKGSDGWEEEHSPGVFAAGVAALKQGLRPPR